MTQNITVTSYSPNWKENKSESQPPVLVALSTKIVALSMSQESAGYHCHSTQEKEEKKNPSNPHINEDKNILSMYIPQKWNYKVNGWGEESMNQYSQIPHLARSVVQQDHRQAMVGRAYGYVEGKQNRANTYKFNSTFHILMY